MATPGYPSTRRYRTDGIRIKLHTAYYNNFWYDNYVNVHIINANIDVLPMINAYVANRLSICFAWYYTRGKLINTGRDTRLSSRVHLNSTKRGAYFFSQNACFRPSLHLRLLCLIVKFLTKLFIYPLWY